VKKGFVVNSNFFDEDVYPLVSSLARKLLKESDFKKMKPRNIEKIYESIGNLLILNLHLIASRVHIKLHKKLLRGSSLELIDLQSRLKMYMDWSHNSLDNSIKQHLVRRPIKVYEDVIAGFDTEYVPIEWKHNELLSAQISSALVTKIKVPISRDYNFESLNTLTSERFVRSEPLFSEVGAVKFFITNSVELIRLFTYGTFDERIRNVSNNLLSMSESFDIIHKTDEHIFFQLKKQPINSLFIKGIVGEKLELSTKTLLNLILGNNEGSLFMKDFAWLSENKVCKEQKFIEKRNDSWNGETLVQRPIKEVILSNELNEALNGEKISLKQKLVEIFKKSLDFKEGENSSFIINFLFNIFQCTSLGKKEVCCLKAQGFPLDNFKEAPPFDRKIFTFSRRIYLTAHFNAADLTLLKDWNSISERNIDLLKKSYVSITSPLMTFADIPVYIRDSLLLSSAAASSLEKVGLGHKMQKIPLDKSYLSNMKLLLNENPEKFKEYGMYDSLITLIHMLFMSDFMFRLGDVRVPLTLGAISAKYLKNKWKQDGYKGHQPNSEYLLGNAQVSHTPKGINSIGFSAENENLHIASFRGGRNECFKYGIDTDTIWCDYDLTSCYATVMSQNGDPVYQEYEESEIIDDSVTSLLGDPDYSKATIIYPNSNLTRFDFKRSYTAIKIRFNLPETIKYPPLPVFMDKTITIYPLNGESIVTGTEFLSAQRILHKALLRISEESKITLSELYKKYYIKIVTGSYIPFRHNDDGTLAYRPFFSAILELQANRAKFKKLHGKGSALERTYKDLGNMIYGKTVCGISNKLNYDPRTKAMKSMIGGPLSNPILGSWITGFVRALIAELLNAVHDLGGEVSACTTDGFTCNIPDLETKILALYEKDGFDDSLLQDYRNSRDVLSRGTDPSGLEVKTSTIGLLQWSTRGQVSYNHTDPSLDNYNVPICAMTGFQKFQFAHDTIKDEVIKAMTTNNKIFYLQKRLTGARDFKQVSYISSLRLFRTVFDSKRAIILDNNSGLMLDTKPWFNIEEAFMTRKVMRKFSNTIYSSKFTRRDILATSYSSREETLKFFIRLVLGYWDFNPTVEQKAILARYVIRFGTATKFIRRIYVRDFINLTLMNPGKVQTPSLGKALSHTIKSEELRKNLLLYLYKSKELSVFRERIAKEL